MAEVEEIKEITECCICNELYTDPRVLPCIHTFCLKCLEDTALKSDQVTEGKMPCPVCRKLFTIPSEGLIDLPKNSLMQKLVEITETPKPSEQRTMREKCVLCDGSPGDVLPLATKYCIQCHQKICDRFRRDHERLKEIKSRQLVELGSQIKYTKKPQLLHQIGTEASIWGLALLNGELFAVSIEGAPSITVYDPSTLKIVRTVSVQGLEYPRDIVSLQPKNCLCLVSHLKSSLFCVDKNGKMLTTWKLSDAPHNLSVTSSGNIIVTCDARILEYNANGTSLRNLRLDADSLKMSWHTILLSNGNFLLCQGWMSSKYHRARIVDPQGNILRSSGSDISLSDPVYLALDTDGYIFVADSGNNSVVLLDKELGFTKRILVKEDGIFQPYRILLDESSGRLFVGTNDRKIHIFKIT